MQRSLDKNIEEISKSGRVVKVAFLVVDDMVFQLESVFRLMLHDPLFDVYIIQVPDVLRGEENMRFKLSKGINVFQVKYPGRVLNSLGDDGKFIDFCERFDIFCVMNPYPGMTHEYYTIKYLAERGKAVVYANYAVGEGTANAKNMDHLKEFSYLWRYYLERPSELARVGKCHRILSKFKRLKVVGAAKTDAFSEVEVRERIRKCVIIAPHHSVPGNRTPLSMGNFIRYAPFFLHLPREYPQIDWIFRPHPLLMWTMEQVGAWKSKDRESYMEALTSYPNVVVSDSGSYYDAFMNSDAMIQDSGSFLAEYHISGRPQCYILRDKTTEETQFNEFGRRMLAHTYKAYSEDDIRYFIERVVLESDDWMKGTRMRFVDDELRYNYPHASEAIVADIRTALGRS